MSNEAPINTQLCDQPQEVVEYWYEKALDYLVDGTFLPLSEEVWESDRYTNIIFEKASQMFAEHHLSC